MLETLLEKLFGVAQVGVSGVDAATRFYVLWRFAYRAATIDAGEAIVFAWPQGVELDGPTGLSAGAHALVEKSRGKYRLRDYLERGGIDDLGRGEGNGPATIIDVLHRVLWLMEYAPNELPAFLDEARPDQERLRVVAQTLGGPTLAGGDVTKVTPGSETSALRKLTTNWRSLITDNLFRNR